MAIREKLDSVKTFLISLSGLASGENAEYVANVANLIKENAELKAEKAIWLAEKADYEGSLDQIIATFLNVSNAVSGIVPTDGN